MNYKMNVSEQLSQKYVISPIDHQEYCRKNGQFLRHIKGNNFRDYQHFFEYYFPEQIKFCQCGQKCLFDQYHMIFKKTCGKKQCVNKISSKIKQNFSKEQREQRTQKFRQTMSQKTVADIELLKKKRKQTYYSRNGIEHRLQKQLHPLKLKKLKDKQWMYTEHVINKKPANVIARELGVGITTATNWLHRHNIKITSYRQSHAEREIVDYINQLDPNIDVKINDRTVIHPMEIDIYLPQYNMGIELNGVFWHGQSNGNKDSKYHLTKSLMCQQKGVYLIHILDQEWYCLQDIVKSRIASILNKSKRIYGRHCTIREISNKQAKNFFDQTHIQKGVQGGISFGLFNGDQMVSAMSFSKSRYNKNHQYELLRFSNKLNTTVVGGASKLFKHFIQKYDPKSIVSYSDKRWNKGNLYKKLGFTLSHTSSPNYKYFKLHEPFELLSRQQFQKHKLKDKLDYFNSNLTEWENMQLNGYDRIWDCGNDVYVWNNDRDLSHLLK